MDPKNHKPQIAQEVLNCKNRSMEDHLRNALTHKAPMVPWICDS